MSALARVAWAGRSVCVEYEWVGAGSSHAEAQGPQEPALVFLHEGLGSVSAWRGFPARLCAAVGRRGLVFSRPGYGGSTPREPEERWGPDYLHRQAEEVLPAVLDAVGLGAQRVVPFGHSDGATIALLFAAAFPDRSAGVVVMAPHILVEDVTLRGIEKARDVYVAGSLKDGLGTHHDDPDSAFWGWADAWLSPAFAGWTIEDELGAIRCPVLAIQGVDDEYGTLEQIRGVARRVVDTTLVGLPGCGHSPHRDAPDAVLAAVGSFLERAER